MKETCRLYSDLAWLWPLWGETSSEYADYSEQVTTLIHAYAQGEVATLLVIGCGGGKNVFNLKRTFQVTGLDLSPTMLAQAQELNPESTFILGDMRTFRLDACFDAVLMDDAIAHMNNRADFEAALERGYAHLNPGGVLVVTPDLTPESFEQNKITTYTVKRDDLDVVFIENIYDPDPLDDQYETTILYLIREQGVLRIETDHWSMGIFSLNAWRDVLQKVGFKVHEKIYRQDDQDYTLFACVKPL
ncbi:class I SAM-dependent methyltransferase [Nitrincola tapanii]|uniref:Class I SAM-dependent methyltransferase n=1 Tax=Nitrincola tapanii TaxID=1708751 RepID=A0A5A9W227_9GAMM|nr:class I SAM-dependent methyltransferase [Nitrincola tapanii]KAA0874145.1 class I SAM-dependent methyltransferase [Nitrincola tapanii]